MLGNKVFYINMKDKKVGEGVVLSRTISQSGYVVNIVFDEEGKHNIENKLIFENKEEAEKALPGLLVISEAMEEKSKECEKVLDVMREQVIGKPEFKELADEFFSK